MHWIVGTVGDEYFVAIEIDINRKTGAKYDKDQAEPFVTHWHDYPLSKERAMRYVDVLYYKTPIVQTDGNPWVTYPKQQRGQITSWRLESWMI